MCLCMKKKYVYLRLFIKRDFLLLMKVHFTAAFETPGKDIQWGTNSLLMAWQMILLDISLRHFSNVKYAHILTYACAYIRVHDVRAYVGENDSMNNS